MCLSGLTYSFSSLNTFFFQFLRWTNFEMQIKQKKTIIPQISISEITTVNALVYILLNLFSCACRNTF